MPWWSPSSSSSSGWWSGKSAGGSAYVNATPNGSSTVGSPYATATPARTPYFGTASANTPARVPYFGPSSTPATSSRGGSVFGKIVSAIPGAHAIANAVGAAAHGVNVAENDTAKVAAGIGTGVYDIGKAAVAPKADPNAGAEWAALLSGHPERMWQIANQTSAGRQQTGAISALAPVGVVKHPGKDPVQTALVAASLLAGGASAAARIGYAAKAASAARIAETGELVQGGSDAANAAEAAGKTVVPLKASEKAALIAKAASPRYTPPTAARALQVPRLVGPEGEEQVLHTPVQLQASGSHLMRAGQAVVDKALQSSLESGLARGSYGPVGKIALKRVGASTAEAQRLSSNLYAVDEALASEAGTKTVGKVLVGHSVFGKGVSAKEGQLASLLRSSGVTGADAARYWGGQAAAGINPKATAALSKVAQSIEDKGLLMRQSDGTLAASPAYPEFARADAAVKDAQGARAAIVSASGRMSPEGMQNRLDLVARTMAGGKFDKASEGIVGGEAGIGKGQGFVSLKTSEKPMMQSGIARSGSNAIPLAKRLALGPKATGEGIAQGLIPESTTGAVARGLHDALRVFNTEEMRQRVANLGSDIRTSPQDILVADPSSSVHAAIPEAYKQLLGMAEDTTGHIDEGGISRALQAILDERIRKSDAQIGTRAPEGWKWVPKAAVPDSLRTASSARGSIEKSADTINSAVTAATVYFKLGHVPTRFLTNLSTNAMEGSALPTELLKSYKTVRALGGMQSKTVRELDALTGGHGYTALPHAGTGIVAKAAGRGAKAYARKIDAPFRVNSILFNLRQIGVDTPEKIEQAVAHLKGEGKMTAAQSSQLRNAVQRSNRASIMYDGMTETERRHVARYLWFWPWTKGAVRFAGHTVAEHPLKAAAGASVGAAGNAEAQRVLGNRPSYELGLTPLSSGGGFPLTANFSTFTPFGTVTTAAQAVQQPAAQIAQQLNPVYAGLAQAAADAIANKSTGQTIQDFFGQATSPTPEAQIASSAVSPRGKGLFPTSSNFLFGRSTQSSLARALVGAGFPRRTNLSRLAIDAAHEHEKKKTLTIYGK